MVFSRVLGRAHLLSRNPPAPPACVVFVGLSALSNQGLPRLLEPVI